MIAESTILSEVAKYILGGRDYLEGNNDVSIRMVYLDLRSIVAFAQQLLETQEDLSFNLQLLQKMDEAVRIWYYDEDETILDELRRFI